MGLQLLLFVVQGVGRDNQTVCDYIWGMRIVNSDGDLVEYNKDKDPEMMKAVQVSTCETTSHYHSPGVCLAVAFLSWQTRIYRHFWSLQTGFPCLAIFGIK